MYLCITASCLFSGETISILFAGDVCYLLTRKNIAGSFALQIVCVRAPPNMGGTLPRLLVGWSWQTYKVVIFWPIFWHDQESTFFL